VISYIGRDTQKAIPFHSLENSAGAAHEILDLIDKGSPSGQCGVTHLPQGHGYRKHFIGKLIDGIEMDRFLLNDLNGPLIAEKDISCYVQVRDHLHLDHLLLDLAHGIDICDEMLQILLRCPLEGLAESIYRKVGHTEKRDQDKK